MLVWLVLLVLTLPTLALGATINAANCTPTAVANAISAAATGDTVHLPSCVQAWDTMVVITKRIILEGNGVGNTILQRSASGALIMFRVSGVTGFEMRNMTLDGTFDTHPHVHRDIGLNLNQSCVDFRIHHMNFTDLSEGIQVQGDPLVMRGLIDNNTFTDMQWDGVGSGATGYGIQMIGSGTYPPLSLGTAQNVFLEDNTHTRNRHAVASNNGTRYVFRHNTLVRNTGSSMNAGAIDAHGFTGTWPQGTRQYEIYENTITDSTTQFCGPCPRGGDGVIWNNVMSPMSSNRDILLLNDSGCSGSYPKEDQIRELYIWGNTRHGGAAAQIQVDSGCGSYIQQNRDYFLIPRPGYGTGYTYPHPLQGGQSPAPDYVSNLRMHLKFDEGTGTTAQDSTANNHDGTLGSGATWGPAKMGASALVLDGTTAGIVTVTGELTTPAAITLAAWVLPSGFPTTRGEVVSLGNAVMLRVQATNIQGYYYTGTTWVSIQASVAPSTTAWTHLAYTVAAGAQRLYVNGELAATGSSAAAPVYTGLGTSTIIGGHGDGLTTFQFQGSIDDVRVYTRALSDTDLAGLADLDDPPPLSVQITTPTTQPSYSTSSALLANMGGVASDATGVTSVTWTCATCTPAVDAAQCTPACGAATTFTNWVIPSLTLGVGTNDIAVTAADASGVRTDHLIVTYTPPPPVGACSHYASQAGGGTGLTQNSPFQVVQFWAVASPGTTLCLLDGTYTGGNSMLQPPSGLSGTVSLPITVRALNDGAVLLDGENARNPVVLGATNTSFVVQGLNARNGLSAVYELLGNDILGQRLIGWNATAGQPNSTIFTVHGQNTWVEDCAAWGANARVLFQGSGGTASTGGYRRCYGEWHSHPGGTAAPGRVMLPGEGQRFENMIGSWNAN